ncbi:hypothetical protein LL06_20875 [Hoeflea sp. BAL378]|uniref:hypothetical protein n=1 Tax=Hoeflea sp. BAL378 TaxID=1547437 RepID=UPI000512B142|nr:hypothetical protein [Hoeflea sp. BAL378]KGF67681.1 hypothetical protein LL06_20875 [Hoeflea sp. BAL378]
MSETDKVEWDSGGDPSAIWDAAEVPIETEEEYMNLCPYVAWLPGPDGRAIYSIDVPSGGGRTRSLACGFADTLDAARTLASEAIERIATGLKAV